MACGSDLAAAKRELAAEKQSAKAAKQDVRARAPPARPSPLAACRRFAPGQVTAQQEKEARMFQELSMLRVGPAFAVAG